MRKIMKVHPLCQMFGTVAPLSADDLAALKDDIKTNGIKVPILVNKKKDTILDGLTRWRIAHDLGAKVQDDVLKNAEVFKGKDEEIESEILSRNLFRRHMTDDQRVMVVSKIRGPQLEKEAKARQSAAGTFKGKGKQADNGAGSVAEHIAKEAGVSKHKAEQAEKARKAGFTEDVISKKTKLRTAAKKAGKKARKPKKEVSWEDQVYKKWTQWLNRFPHPKRQEVMQLVKKWIG